MTPDAAAPIYVAERNLQRALDRAAAGHPLVTVGASTLVMEGTELHFSDVAAITTHLRWLGDHPDVRAHVGATAAPIPPPAVIIDRRRRHAIHSQATHSQAPNRLDAGAMSTIRLPDSRFGRRQMTVLHEYAHHLVPTGGHGSRFCGALILLVGVGIGPVAALMLTEQLSMHGVIAHLPATSR